MSQLRGDIRMANNIDGLCMGIHGPLILWEDETMEKQKYDSEYISYLESWASAAVLIVRDVVKSIRTRNMWIDPVEMEGRKNKYGRWAFSEITVELFPRKIQPKYPKNAIKIRPAISPGRPPIRILTARNEKE